LPVPTNDTGDIYLSAVSILDAIRLKKSVRLLGVSLSSLSKGEEQLQLFWQPDEDKKAALAKAVDAVNDKFGEHTVTHASTVAQEKEQRVISPAWRPSGVRKSDV
jgi:DNA polymerase-4